MPSHYGGEFDLTLRRLRKWAPSNRTLKVRTVSKRVLDKYHGRPTAGDYDDDLCLLRIARNMKMYRAIEALIHEYAHHLAGLTGSTHDDHHSDEWGVCYARAYRAWQTPLPTEQEEG